jgi:hypothetical protein
MLASCILGRFVSGLVFKNETIEMYKTPTVLPVILCGFERLSVTVREEHVLRVFEMISQYLVHQFMVWAVRAERVWETGNECEILVRS